MRSTTRLVGVFCLLFCDLCVVAQERRFDNVEYVEQNAPDIYSQPELLYDVGNNETQLYHKLVRYSFFGQTYRYRGIGSSENNAFLEGSSLSNPFDGRINYGLCGALSLGRLQFRYGNESRHTLSKVYFRNRDYGCQWSSQIGKMTDVRRVSATFSDRSPRIGIVVSSTGKLSNTWSHLISIRRRWGRDAQIDGVFKDHGDALMVFERRTGKSSSLTILGTISPNQQGLRTSVTRETIELRGDNLYNPSWGYDDGRQRNARVRTEYLPMAMVSWRNHPSEKYWFGANMSMSWGEQKLSGLAWHNADNPSPDYYRQMPSMIADPNVANITATAWRDNNLSVTQIDWSRMKRINARAGETYYLQQKQRSRTNDMQINLHIGVMPRSGMTLSAGVRIRHSISQRDNLAKDLLEGVSFPDYDYFLSNEQDYSTPIQSDINHRDRLINEGNRFDYYYNLIYNRIAPYAELSYDRQRLKLSGAVEIGAENLRRKGIFAKQSATDFQSEGLSSQINFDTYRFALSSLWRPSVKHLISVDCTLEQTAPRADNIFLEPRYANSVSESRSTENRYSAEIGYRFINSWLKLEASLYARAIENRTEIYRYYDDIFSQNGMLDLTGINLLNRGIEIAAEAALTPRLMLSIGATMARFSYTNNPKASFTDAPTMTCTTQDQTVYLKDFRIGNAPSTAATAEIKYNTSNGWLLGVSVNTTADAYVEPNPVRRTRRAMATNTTTEQLTQLTRQEKLPIATTANLFLMKSFSIGKSFLYITLSVRNLLNNKGIILGGWEQMRLLEVATGTETRYAPFDNKYIYGYARNYYMSVNYRF